MSARPDPTAYPIVLRVVKGYVEASQPDLEIYRVRGKFSDLKRRDEIGAVVMDVWNEIIERMKNPDIKLPSNPKGVIHKGYSSSLKCGEAAHVLGISKSAIRSMCESGDLQAFRTKGGHWKIRASDPTLSRFLPKEEN